VPSSPWPGEGPGESIAGAAQGGADPTPSQEGSALLAAQRQFPFREGLGQWMEELTEARAAGPLRLDAVRDWLMNLSGVTEVYDRDTAARKLELPVDRVGELVVLSGRDVVLGRTPEYHDLKALEGGLRSHGGRYEEMVPFLLSEPLKPDYAARAAGDPRNFDIFDFTVNGTRMNDE